MIEIGLKKLGMQSETLHNHLVTNNNLSELVCKIRLPNNIHNFISQQVHLYYKSRMFSNDCF